MVRTLQSKQVAALLGPALTARTQNLDLTTALSSAGVEDTTAYLAQLEQTAPGSPCT